jgi:hypothetical protein
VKRSVTIGVLAFATVLTATGAGRAVDKEAVNAAVERGVRNLKAFQSRNGTWPHDHSIGLTALCGLTLLECGVPVDDEAIQKAAAAIREASVTLDHNYSIALSILFLDRLGEPVDVALIESLTVRLLAAQSTTGSWSYNSPPIGAEEQRRLTTLVKKRSETGRDKEAPKPEPGQRTVKDLPKEVQAQLDHVARMANRTSGGDNSNTQFAVLALWVARRHGLPVDAALKATDRYFRTTVYPEGAWGYVPPPPSMPAMPVGALRPPFMKPSPAMTCAGLLGVGLAYGAWNDAALRTDTHKKEPGRPGPAPVKAKDPSKDKVVTNAFNMLGVWVDAMAADRGKGKAPQVNQRNGKFYYFLWSLERVCVAYGVDKVGKTDWYDWGAEILLANQGNDGGWNGGEFPSGPDTCFALLFLKKANLAQDLSRALKSQMKDGMQAALHQGGFGGGNLMRSGNKPFFDGPVAEDPKHKPADDEDARAARLGKQLAAEGDKGKKALEELRDNKGAAYTEALAHAIPRLEGDSLKKAREALAERMSRMTSATLGVKLEDDDAEVRRAAALAVAMKEDKAYTYKLIEMLSDQEATVGHAAHAALKSLTNEDFGPAKGAGREERTKAILAWKAWWFKQQGDK